MRRQVRRGADVGRHRLHADVKRLPLWRQGHQVRVPAATLSARQRLISPAAPAARAILRSRVARAALCCGAFARCGCGPVQRHAEQAVPGPRHLRARGRGEAARCGCASAARGSERVRGRTGRGPMTTATMSREGRDSGLPRLGSNAAPSLTRGAMVSSRLPPARSCTCSCTCESRRAEGSGGGFLHHAKWRTASSLPLWRALARRQHSRRSTQSASTARRGQPGAPARGRASCDQALHATAHALPAQRRSARPGCLRGAGSCV